MRRRDPAPVVPSVFREQFSDRLGRWALRAAQLLLVTAVAVLAIYALIQIRLLVIPIVIAIILAAAATPLIHWLRKGVSPFWAAWIVLLGGVVVLGGIVTGIVFAVRGQWEEIVQSARDGYDELLGWFESLNLPVEQVDWQMIRDQVVGFVTSAQFGSGAIAGVTTAFEIVTGAVLVLVILFFLLKDGDRIWWFFIHKLDDARRERGERIGHVGVRVLGAYARGTLIIAAIDGASVGITMLILQVPLALPLAALVFLGAFVPIVGATVTGVLAGLVALVTNGWVAALVIGIVIVAVSQIEGDVLQPLIMGQSVRLHPLVILASLTAGTILGGIAGAVLAVPVAAVGWAILRVWDAPESALDEGKPQRRRRGAT